MPSARINGLTTYYEVAGSGPPLLLISGSSLDHTNFDLQLKHFSQHFTCITYDLRGVGQTDVPDDVYTIKDLAGDAAALLDHLGIDSAHVGGYSLGGCVGLELALASPERVRTLSLYSTLDRADPYTRRRTELRSKILLETTPEIYAAFTILIAFGQEYINDNEQVVEAEYQKRVARWRSSTPEQIRGVAGHYQAILSHDVTDRLGDIRCPTWISVGTSDSVTPQSYSERLHRLIAGSELKIFPGAPHRILTFLPEPFSEAALEFLLRHKDVAPDAKGSVTAAGA